MPCLQCVPSNKLCVGLALIPYHLTARQSGDLITLYSRQTNTVSDVPLGAVSRKQATPTDIPTLLIHPQMQCFPGSPCSWSGFLIIIHIFLKPN